MPQLDKFSFFSQIFWLFLLFILFYLLLILIILPNLASILKIRFKKLFLLKEENLSYVKIELNLFQLKLKNIINILLVTNNSISHYNFLLDKYIFAVDSKVKNFLILREKVDDDLIFEIVSELFGVSKKK